MEIQKFPPSPNWYLCDIICCGPNGNVIYGSRNTLVVARFGDKLFEKFSFPKFEIIEHAHKERVTTIRFCPNKTGKYSNCFASAGDDSLVKLWDMNTLSPISANFAHGETKKVISMDWSWKSTNIILSLDDANTIVVWDIEKNTTVKLNVVKLLQMKKSSGLKASAGKLQPLILKCCPHQHDLVAVGMKGGLVCLITLKDSGKILHCMRGHDKDVTSLSWCPAQENVLGAKCDADQDKAFLLASVCKDRCIFIWRAIDGRYQRSIKLPNTFLGRHSRLPATGTYLTLDWCEKESIICSSNYGEILRYDPSSEGNSENKISGNDDDVQNNCSNSPRSPWKLVHDIHPRGVFAVHCAQYLKTGEAGEEKEMVVWTTAQDRQLVAVALSDGKVLVNIPTIGGFVYCMGSSPFDPTRIAVGLGDFSIRVWNTGNTKEVQMSTLWQKIKGKVMAIAWHPTQEMKLAFGTHEGRVGIQEITPGRLPVVFILRHMHSVYALSWGPPCYKEGESGNLPQFCLYSCGDGEILQYNPDEPLKEPKRMSILMKGCEEVKKSTCTDVAWKPDYSLLAVGNNDGTVQLYSPPHLKLIYTLYAHRKLLMTLTWHPLSTSSDTGLSPMRHWLATGSNDSVIHVFDLSNLTKAVAGTEYKNPVQSVAALTGHQKKVVRLSWNPHSSGQLCSASYDNTIRVWDVVHQTCMACFTGHSGAGLACMWSPLDPDIIISGSTDFTLCAWRISEAKYVPKPSANATQSKKTPAIAPQPGVKIEKPDKAGEGSELSDGQKAKAAKDVESNKPFGFGFKWKGSLFPISWKVAGGIGVIDGVRSLLEKDDGEPLRSEDDPNDAKLRFFGSREDMHDLLQKEEDHHKSVDNIEQAQLIGLWRGNTAETIKDAIAKEKLNDWLVSMAPSVSHKVWMEACQAYSEQLTKSGKINHAATYLLACHKVDEAINLLRSRSLYREALAIARCRLAPDDPTAHNLTLEWGRNLLLKGNYEVSAMCFTSIGEYIEAARALASRSSYPECVAMGAKLALKAGAKGRELAIVFTMQCIHMYLQNSNWDAALECIKQVKELKPLSLVVELHRRLEEGFQANKDGGGSDLLHRWLTDKEDCNVDSSASSILNLSPLPWTDDEELSADNAYSSISTRRADRVVASTKNFMLELAEELALSICASGGESNKKWNHILKAMALCYSHQLLAPTSEVTEKHCLLQFCVLLVPNGPKDIEQLFGVPETSTSAEGFVRSARAYCAFAAAAWSEEKWVTENEQEWPWLSLASLLLSFLPDILDPEAGAFFKAEVEIRKMEQWLIIAKARSRAGGKGEKVVGIDKQTVGENGTSAEEGSIMHNGSSGGESEEVVALPEEENDGKTLEEVINEKESELATIRDMRQSFEKCRVSAPNPFICLFKLRNVCDMIVKCTGSEEKCSSKDIMDLKEKVTAGITQ